MKKEELNYYDEFINMSNFAVEISKTFRQLVEAYTYDATKEQEKKVHEKEHEADKTQHKISHEKRNQGYLARCVD